MERIAIAIQDGGAGTGARHEAAARAARLACAEGPPVGGAFWFQTFIQAPSPKIWSETISGGEEVLAGKWGGLFLGYLLGKNFRRRKRGFVRRVISEAKISGIDWRLGRNCLIHFRDCIDPISTWLRP